MIPSLAKNPKRTRELIIDILGSIWPVSAKKIHTTLRKKYMCSVSYQAVHKILKEMAKNGIIVRVGKLYQLNMMWITGLKDFSDQLGRIYKIKSKSKTNMVAHLKVYITPDDFYKHLIRMCRQNKFLRLSAKTPLLFLTREANLSALRKKYYQLLVDRISKGKLKVKYLFSTELTEGRILEENDAQAVKRLRKFLDMPGLKLKHAPLHSVFTMVVGSRECMIGFASPSHTDIIGVLHLMHEDTEEMTKIYDSMFAHAQEPLGLVEKLEAQLNRKPNLSGR